MENQEMKYRVDSKYLDTRMNETATQIDKLVNTSYLEGRVSSKVFDAVAKKLMELRIVNYEFSFDYYDVTPEKLPSCEHPFWVCYVEKIYTAENGTTVTFRMRKHCDSQDDAAIFTECTEGMSLREMVNEYAGNRFINELVVRIESASGKTIVFCIKDYIKKLCDTSKDFNAFIDGVDDAADVAMKQQELEDHKKYSSWSTQQQERILRVLDEF